MQLLSIVIIDIEGDKLHGCTLMSDCNTSGVFEDALECLEKPSNELLVSSSISQVEILISEMRTHFQSSLLDELLKIQSSDQALRDVIHQERFSQQRRLMELERVVAKLKNDIVDAFDELRAANRLSTKQYFDGVELDSFLHKPVGVRPPKESSANKALERISKKHRDVIGSDVLRADLVEGLSPRGNSWSPFKRRCDEIESETVCQPDDEDDDDVSNYREFSLMAIANRSLDMSRSLTERCSKFADLQLVDDCGLNSSSAAVVTQNQHSPNIGSHDETMTTEEALKLTSANKQSVPPPETHENSSPLNSIEGLRLKVSHEILNTERKYCSCLFLLREHFSAALLQSGVMTPDDVQIMFPPCLAFIHESHNLFLRQLECHVNESPSTLIGDALESFVTTLERDLLAYYKLYVSLFPAALVKLRKISRQNDEFYKVLKILESHPSCEGLDVASFLLTPVQRIPRYVLLFRQLLRHTKIDHEDYVHLERCISRLGDCLSDLNESIERSMAAVSATSQCVSPSAKPKRRFHLSAFSFRSSLDTPSNQRNASSKLDQKDGFVLSVKNPIHCAAHLRRNLPSFTSTPITSRHEHCDSSNIRHIEPAQRQSNLDSFAADIAHNKENRLKWPSRLSATNISKPTWPGLVSCPSSGSLFNISSVEWDRSRVPSPLRSSTDSSESLVPLPADPRNRFAFPGSAVGSVPDVAKSCRPPIPTALPDSGKVNAKRKLSESSDTSHGSGGILQRFARRKSVKLSMCNDESIVSCSQVNDTKLKTRRKPAFRDSIKRIFSRRGFNLPQNSETFSSSTVAGCQSVCNAVSQLKK